MDELSSLPRVADYLRRLPRGLESYPECLAKRGGLYDLVKAPRFELLRPMLPSGFEQLYDHQLPGTGWVAEVWHHALVLGMRDVCFASDEAFLDFFLQLNRALLDRAVYKLLFTFLTPVRLFKGAPQRWTAFHRGSVLRPLRIVPGEASFALSSPPHLFTPLVARHYFGAFRAAAEAAAKSGVVIDLRACTAVEALFRVRWQE